jgi:Tfp pilus assembly protein PilW
MKTMNNRALNNKSGFTLIELMVAALITIFILSAVISVFTHQEKLMRTERQETFARGLGRTVIAQLSQNILLAGLGLPSGAGITDGSNATSITFIANTDNVHTMMDADIASADTQIDVDNADIFSVGDWLCIMSLRRYTQFLDTALTPDLNWGQCVEATAVNNGADRITFGAITGAPADLTAATMSESLSTADGVMVSKIEMVVYAFDAANNRITQSINGGAATPITTNVADLQFVYMDQANATIVPSATNYKTIRKVGITLQIEDPINPEASITFTTDLNLRNNGV